MSEVHKSLLSFKIRFLHSVKCFSDVLLYGQIVRYGIFTLPLPEIWLKDCTLENIFCIYVQHLYIIFALLHYFPLYNCKKSMNYNMKKSHNTLI